MFALFFSLYYSMFVGTWTNVYAGGIITLGSKLLNTLGEYTTSIFNNVDTPMSTLGDIIFGTTAYSGMSFLNFYALLALVLATITSIGIVVMAVKGVKKAFGIFFMGINRL